MKPIKYITTRVLGIMALALIFALPAKAQLSDNGYASVDWKFNIPISNSFADKASGWGMNFEGGYFLSDNIGLGLFLNYSSIHKYVPKQTLALSSTESLTTDQQHTIFQLPFGAAIRYQFNRGNAWQPYIAVKLGASYAKYSSDFSVFESRDKTWGFYASPEVGLNIFPWSYGPGLHIALYYNYASNKCKDVLTYSESGLNNFGFTLGVAF